MICLTYKKIFSIKKIPLFPILYRFCYDNKTLSNPVSFNGITTPIKILVRYLFKYHNQHAILNVYTYKGKISHKINLKNTQYHSIYFRRFKEGYEPDVLSLIDLLLPTDGVLYDIGSNWGIFSLYSLCRIKNLRTAIAIDCQENVLKDLSKIKESHPELFARLKIVNAAISSSQDRKLKFKSKDNFHTGLFQRTNDPRGTEIFTSTIDSLHLKKPNLIKIDIEGMEIDAILGAKKTITNHEPYIIVENPQKNRQYLLDVCNNLKYVPLSVFIISSKNNVCMIDLKGYSIYSNTKNILCIPRSRYVEFNELIKPLTSEVEFML